MPKATVKNIEEGTEAEYVCLDTGEVCAAVFHSQFTRYINQTFDFWRDDKSNELWKFIPDVTNCYDRRPIEEYLHQDWLEFLEPVQTRMI